MKFFSTTKSNLTSKFFAVSAIAVSAILFASCGKGTDYSTPDKGYLTIVNASPTLASYNVYLNDTKAVNGALPFNGAAGYLALNTGQYTIKFTSGSSTDKIIDKQFSIASQQNFSVFLLNKGANLELFQVEDKLKTINKGKAQLRFINLSQDAPEMGLVVKDGEKADETVTFIENKVYKQSSDFIELDAKAYSFLVTDKSNATKTTIEKTTLKEGKIYTIMVSGLVTPGDKEQPFGAKLYSN